MFAKLLSASASLILSVAGGASAADTMPTKFTVRIENITKPNAFTASNGMKWSLGFSPGVAVVHTKKSAVFTVGKKDRGKGLEAQSEEGDPSMLAKSLEGGKGIKSVTLFNTPVAGSAPGPITPGAAYEFTLSGTRPLCLRKMVKYRSRGATSELKRPGILCSREHEFSKTDLRRPLFIIPEREREVDGAPKRRS
jgi:hypothetical protein